MLVKAFNYYVPIQDLFDYISEVGEPGLDEATSHKFFCQVSFRIKVKRQKGKQTKRQKDGIRRDNVTQILLPDQFQDRVAFSTF